MILKKTFYFMIPIVIAFLAPDCLELEFFHEILHSEVREYLIAAIGRDTIQPMGRERSKTSIGICFSIYTCPMFCMLTGFKKTVCINIQAIWSIFALSSSDMAPFLVKRYLDNMPLICYKIKLHCFRSRYKCFIKSRM